MGTRTVPALAWGHMSDAPESLRPIEISPSVLPANFARLGDDVVALAEAGVDRIHWDVMDGVFVPNLSFGPDVIASCRDLTDLHFEAHLMVVEPDRLLSRYVDAGCGTVLVHAEAATHLHRTLDGIRKLGARSGVVLNPATPASAIRHVLDVTDIVLVMSVNPGFGGQSYIPTMEPKVAEIRRMIVEGGHDVDLEIDGGIGPATVAGPAAAGANVFVAGSAIFNHPGGLAAATAEIRAAASAARES